jgi:DNA-binding MarR family transcriptional regulator
MSVSVTPEPRKGSRAALADELVRLSPLMRRRIEGLMPAELRQELRDVTLHQMEAVGCLSEVGGLTMNELAKQQGCALSTATAMADRLVKAGLVERVADPDDRRVVQIRTTPRATELFNRVREAKRSAMLEALQVLTTDELHAYVQILRKIAEGGAARG